METSANISEEKILFKGKRFFIINDSFPVSQGHKLIISNEPRKDYFDLNQSELMELDDMIYMCKEMIEKDHKPDGYNIGMNCGEAAGQTVFQFHCHVIPRYKGDMKNPRGGVRHCVEGKGYYPLTDIKTNPFATKSWLKDSYGLTPHRQGQLAALIGKSADDIFNLPSNSGRYPAFTGIRWGFAELKDERLLGTMKWNNRNLYDEYGEIKKIGKNPNNTKNTFKKKVSDLRTSKSLTREELINKLKSFNAKKEIDRYISKNGLNNKTCREILDFAFGNSIKRAFHHENPTLRFKNWRAYKSSEKIVTRINNIESQKEFDLFIFDLADTLVKDWGSYSDDGYPSRMNIGIALKIVNLILKPLAFSSHNSNHRIISFLHVPWDKFTLGNLATIWKEYPPIPHSPTQGFVKDLELYKRLHILISSITEEAGVPRINYEFWSWDYVHN